MRVTNLDHGTLEDHGTVADTELDAVTGGMLYLGATTGSEAPIDVINWAWVAQQLVGPRG